MYFSKVAAYELGPKRLPVIVDKGDACQRLTRRV